MTLNQPLIGRAAALTCALALLVQTTTSATSLSTSAPDTAPPAAAQSAGAVLDGREIRAQLTPLRYTTLAAEMGAKIERLAVAEGGRFKAGDTLVRFDCISQQAQLSKAKAALSASEKTRDANQKLQEFNSVGKLELAVSEAEVDKARADVDSHAAVVSKCSIKAPFSGRVAEQKVREQQYVQPGQALLDVLDDSQLELEFIVPSKWLAWVKPGQGFRVAIDETGKTYPAKVQRIGARVDPASQSVKLSAVVTGRHAELIAGMSGQVQMTPPTTP